MKVYIFILIAISLQCIAALYFDNFKEALENYEKYVEEMCVKQSKVLPQLVENLKSKGIFEDNEKLKEFVFCYDSIMRFMDEKDNINKDIMMYNKDAPDVKTKRGIYERCGIPDTDSPHEKMLKVMKCRKNKFLNYIS
ncbi:hypothetical protein FQA39_LY11674 [Lamprigera yunnana]|nr:hypothetical protein FQA39_LY11674 [Lamprigera yunnana]